MSDAHGMGLGMVDSPPVLASRRSESMKIIKSSQLACHTVALILVNYSLLNLACFFCSPLNIASLTSCVCNMAAFQTAV